MSFAEHTTVPISKTRGEIEALVEKHGATRFASGWTEDSKEAISFALRGRLIRFVLSLPTQADGEKVRRKRYPYRLTGDALAQWIAGESRRRWRCLLLALKAKLEVVESGIASFDEEFLAHIVTTGNLTVYEALKLEEDNGVRLLEAVGQ